MRWACSLWTWAKRSCRRARLPLHAGVEGLVRPAARLDCDPFGVGGEPDLHVLARLEGRLGAELLGKALDLRREPLLGLGGGLGGDLPPDLGEHGLRQQRPQAPFQTLF